MSVFRWFGDRIQRAVLGDIETKLHRAGAAVVARAQSLAPVDTGALRASIGYVVAGETGQRMTLSIQVGMPYGIYQEFGTRYMRPHPYIRPALNEIGRIFGADIQMDFTRGGPAQWHGLLATGPGFAASPSPRWRPLTPKQIRHVQRHLIPTSKRLYRGNVKRARMRVRRID